MSNKKSCRRNSYYLTRILLLTALAVGGVHCTEKHMEIAPEITETFSYEEPSQEKAKAEPVVEEPHHAQKTPPTSKESSISRKVASTKSRSSVYVVQIGAFTKKENAERLSAALKEKKYPVMIKNLKHRIHGPMYLVRLEPMATKIEASNVMAELKKNENLEPVILIVNK